MRKHMFMLSALFAAFASFASPFTEGGVTYTPNDEVMRRQPVVTGVNVTGMVESVTYTRAEVDRRIETNAPVRSVNGMRGDVRLGAREVGALPDNRAYLEDDANFVNAVRNVQVKGGGGVDTNAVIDVVNAAIATNSTVSGKRDKTDLKIAEPKNEHWTWTSNDPSCPDGWLAEANKFGSPKPTAHRLFDTDTYVWFVEEPIMGFVSSQFPGTVSDKSIPFSFSGGVLTFSATATRESATDTTPVLVDEIVLVSQLPSAEQLLTAEQRGEIAKVKDKADEFTEWEFSDPFNYRNGYAEWFDTIGRWMLNYEVFSKGHWYDAGVEAGTDKDIPPLNVTLLTGITATRKRVLRTGDAATPQELTNAISTNNPAFVSAVRDTPTSGMPEDMPTDWGTYSTVGAALAALASAVTWLKKNKVGQVEVDDAKAELNERIDIIEATSHPNMSIVGALTFTEGVVSGFSATDYLMFPTDVNVGQNAVDFYMAFTTGANVTAQQNILDSWCGIAFAINNGGTVTAASQDGTTFVTATSAGTISANSSYRLKLEFRYAGGSYTVTTKLATGSGEYSQVGGVVTLTAPVHPTATYWGGANPTSGTNHIFGGSINLAECRMDWNGKTVWRGYTEVPTYSKGVRDDGSPVDAELNGFFTESNGLLKETIAAKSIPAFSLSSTYEVGEVVLHGGAAYKCVTAITTAEAWTASHWTAATDAEIAARLKGFRADGSATDAFAADLLSKRVAITAVQGIVNDMFDNGDTTAYPRTNVEG